MGSVADNAIDLVISLSMSSYQAMLPWVMPPSRDASPCAKLRKGKPRQLASSSGARSQRLCQYIRGQSKENGRNQGYERTVVSLAYNAEIVPTAILPERLSFSVSNETF